MRIKGQQDIEISINEGGYICMKQKHEDEGEQMIEFAPAYGVKVAEAIDQLKEFAQAKFEKAALVDD